MAAHEGKSGGAGGAFVRFLLLRVAFAVLVILGVVVITFFLARVVPANVAGLWAGTHATAAQLAAAQAQLHLNDPLPIQFWYYLTGLLQGNLGVSILTHRPVAEDIARYLPATLELISASLLLALLIGIPLGVYAGVKRGRWPDHATRLLSVGGVALPSFWFAIVLQMVFVGELHWLPTSGRFSVDLAITSPIHTITGFLTIDSLLQGNLLRFGDAIAHLILPAVTLALYPIGLVARMVRTMMIEVLGENYVRTAKAYGLPARFIHYRYALKNAISPAIVAVGLSFAYELTGAFLIENIFSWNGIGQYAFNAVLNFDYPAVLGTTIVVAIFYVAVNLVVDVIQSFLDPRIVVSKAEG